jgi:valyl-tRNA synthetase
LCYVYIEIANTQIADQKTHQSTNNILIYVLATSLKLLHPFMSFVTTQVYSSLSIKEKNELMLSAWLKV